MRMPLGVCFNQSQVSFENVMVVVLITKVNVPTKISQLNSGRAKVSPQPWHGERAHETGCGCPVGASRYGSNPT